MTSPPQHDEVAKRIISLIDQAAKECNRAVCGQGKKVKDYWIRPLMFGSRALNAAVESSDLDLLLLIPHTDIPFPFFGDFADVYLPLQGVTVKAKVTEARVRVLKLECSGVDVDVLLVRIHSQRQPSDEDLRSNNIFNSIDEPERANINGIRTIMQIKRLVPNMKVYSQTLRAVKQWANSQEVYGTVFTYPGGVGCAVMTAKVCQLNHTVTDVSTMFRRFFTFYAEYFRTPLQKRSPIFITESDRPQIAPRIQGLPETWDRQKKTDELFVVLNPAYPYVNTTYGVGLSSLKHLAHEVYRANRALNAAPLMAIKSDDVSPLLQKCLAPIKRDSWPYCMVVTVVAGRTGRHGVPNSVLEQWLGYVESKVKFIIYGLEANRNLEVRLYPTRVVLPADALERKIVRYFIFLKKRSDVRSSPPPYGATLGNNGGSAIAPNSSASLGSSSSSLEVVSTDVESTFQEFLRAIEMNVGNQRPPNAENPVYTIGRTDSVFEPFPFGDNGATASSSNITRDRKRPRDDE